MRTTNVEYKFLDVLSISMERYLSLEDLDGEFWKPLPGYEGFYEVSSLGRVKVLERDSSYGDIKRITKTHILKPKSNGRKYWCVGLCIKNEIVYRYVHRLVALTFLDNPEHKPEVDHLNTNTHDNRLCNLSWSTHMENEYNPITRFKKIIRENSDVPLVQLTILGEKIAEWNNVREAAYFNGIKDTVISGNINHPNRNLSACGFVFMRKVDFENGKFVLPILKSSSKVYETGIPSYYTVVLYLRGAIKNVYPSNTLAANVFSVSPSTIKTMCKHSVIGKYKSHEIQFRFFKDISIEDQMFVRKMLLNKRNVADC